MERERPRGRRRRVVEALLLLAVAAASIGPKPAAAEVDLRGTWSRTDYQQSTEARRTDPKTPSAPPAALAAGPAFPAVRIAHDGGAVIMEFLGEDGTVLSSQRFTTDGAESVTRGPERGVVRRTRSRWNETGLITKWRLQRRGRTVMSGVDVWSLSNDRRTLTLNSTIEDARTRTTTRSVHTRR